MKKKFIILNDDPRQEPFTGEFIGKLKKCGIEYRAETCRSLQDYIKYGEDIDILFNQGVSRITKEIIENMPDLKAIIRRGIGYDNVDIEAAAKKGICVSNTPGFCAEEVSTHAIALLLAYVRKIPHWHNWTRNKRWEKGEYSFTVEPPYGGLDTLKNEKVGIIGFGFIGRSIYKKLSPFSPDFYINDKYVKISSEIEGKQVELDKIMKECKYIILCCPLTDETFHLLDEKQFKLMRRDAVVINVGRGKLINEKVMIKYLAQKKIEGAALDVFEQTPISKNNKLLELDNVVISPHNGGMSPKSVKRSFEMSYEEIVRIASGKAPECRVN